MPLHHAPGVGQRAHTDQRRRTGGAQAQDSLARRHHAPDHVAAGVHAAAGSAGATPAAAPDRFHGVLAPNAKLRALVVPQEPEVPTQAAQPAQCEANCGHHRPVRLSWAKLLKRVFEIDLEHGPNCGGELKIIDMAHRDRTALHGMLDVSVSPMRFSGSMPNKPLKRP